MVDEVHAWTDRQVLELEQRIKSEYSRAYDELRRKRTGWLREYDIENTKWLAALKDGKVNEGQYKKWLKEQATLRVYHNTMLDGAYDDMMTTARRTAEIVNGVTPGIYAENANFATYQIEQAGQMGTSLTLYDQATVQRLLVEQPDVMPWLSPDPDKIIPGFRRKVRSEVTQGILQGESMDNIAKRLRKAVGMEQGASIRAARTAVTGAENMGRLDTFHRAEKMGIKLKQEWRATYDDRTRPSHKKADGQKVAVGEKFKVGEAELECPGDPHGPYDEICNCRCTLVPVVEGYETDAATEVWNGWRGMGYSEWKETKPVYGKKKRKKKKDDGGKG